MAIRDRLASLLGRLTGTSSHVLSDVPFSVVTMEYAGHTYRIRALERRIAIQRLPEGEPIAFSDDKDAPHRDLVQEAFDGFEWELTTLCKLIDLYEEQIL
ncbi:MAG: hypothetical protein ABI700_00425 [Chloroflexota bacterium]